MSRCELGIHAYRMVSLEHCGCDWLYLKRCKRCGLELMKWRMLRPIFLRTYDWSNWKKELTKVHSN